MLQIERFGPVIRYRIAKPVPFGLRPLWVHAFLVDGLLIDTGSAPVATELLAATESEGVGTIVLTHHHEDHVGGAPLFLQKRGLLPQIHPAGLKLLSTYRPIPWYERLFWGQHQPALGAPLGETVETGRYRFRVIHTPGHAPDHVALYEPDQGWLFAGDLLIHPKLPTLARWDDLPAMFASLRTLLKLPAEQVFCSHYPKVGGMELIRAKLDFWGEKAARVADLHRKGLPLDEIRFQVLGPEVLMAYVTGGQFSKRNLIRGLLALAGGVADGRPTEENRGA